LLQDNKDIILNAYHYLSHIFWLYLWHLPLFIA
jgi:hypothetical protein